VALLAPARTARLNLWLARWRFLRERGQAWVYLASGLPNCDLFRRRSRPCIYHLGVDAESDSHVCPLFRREFCGDHRCGARRPPAMVFVRKIESSSRFAPILATPKLPIELAVGFTAAWPPSASTMFGGSMGGLCSSPISQALPAIHLSLILLSARGGDDGGLPGAGISIYPYICWVASSAFAAVAAEAVDEGARQQQCGGHHAGRQRLRLKLARSIVSCVLIAFVGRRAQSGRDGWMGRLVCQPQVTLQSLLALSAFFPGSG